MVRTVVPPTSRSPALTRIPLQTDLSELTLFCPFCGECIVARGEEGYVGPCEHTVCCGIDDPGEAEITEFDLVLVASDGAMDKIHVFAFREPWPEDSGRR